MRFFILLFACLFLQNLSAQKIAITDEGEEVLLFNDGTWKYKQPKDREVEDIFVNPKPFTYPEAASFKLKSKVTNMAFRLDPKVWKVTTDNENEDAEYELELRKGDGYAMMITEEIPIPIDNLMEIAIDNAREVAPDIEVVEREYRTVNGQEVLLLHMEGTLTGIPIAYYGYYYSNDTGTLQFMTFTAQSIMKKYKSSFEDLLNGLILQE